VTISNQPVEFVTLWTSHAPKVYAYIFSLVYNFADADDVLQETSLVLLRKFHEFEPGTNFSAWACRIAYLEVLEFHRRGRLLEHLDEEVLERVHFELGRIADGADARTDALSECLKKLSEKDRRLVELRYQGNCATAIVANMIGRTVSAVHKALARIHESLLECIRRRLAEEGRT
jgi:RNA polymerase sigma-70 factor (ECF subfamily)